MRTFFVYMLISMTGLLHLYTTARAQNPDRKFLKLLSPLDEPRGLCVDIPGHRNRVDIKKFLVLHTCKTGIWNIDEQFDAAAFRSGFLKMPEYQLCVRGVKTATGLKLKLAECNSSEARWLFKNAFLRPYSFPKMCLTAGAGPSLLTPGGKRLPSRHVARGLILLPCDDKLNHRQRWQLIDIE